VASDALKWKERVKCEENNEYTGILFILTIINKSEVFKSGLIEYNYLLDIVET
jgi:hypothetical protein